jgi:hypothetical protein
MRTKESVLWRRPYGSLIDPMDRDRRRFRVSTPSSTLRATPRTTQADSQQILAVCVRVLDTQGDTRPHNT